MLATGTESTLWKLRQAHDPREVIRKEHSHGQLARFRLATKRSLSSVWPEAFPSQMHQVSSRTAASLRESIRARRRWVSTKEANSIRRPFKKEIQERGVGEKSCLARVPSNIESDTLRSVPDSFRTPSRASRDNPSGQHNRITKPPPQRVITRNRQTQLRARTRAKVMSRLDYLLIEGEIPSAWNVHSSSLGK
jgi:hypothetical protein